MAASDDGAAIVRAFFERMQARDWDAAAALLAADVDVAWPATRERFRGGCFLAMQRAYPEGWEIVVEEALAEGGRVAARVRVDQDGLRFWCSGFYDVRDGRIAGGVEYWLTEGADEPPAWRAAYAGPDPPAPT